MKLDKRQLFSALWLELSTAASDWLKTAVHQMISDNHQTAFDAFVTFSAMTRRKVGEQALTTLEFNSDSHCVWHIDEAARIFLLTELLDIFPPEQVPQQVKAAFKCGDESEQIAIIKALDLLDESGELLDLAISTGRTNSLNLFAAIALNNPYPAKHYQARAYQQLVLKTLFMDLDISQMIGLAEQRNEQMSQLAMDLVKERLAAGRNPPGGIALAIEPSHLNENDLEQYQQLI